MALKWERVILVARLNLVATVMMESIGHCGRLVDSVMVVRDRDGSVPLPAPILAGKQSCCCKSNESDD